ncbi:MAG: acylphosphatase [Desulfuromonas sp.]|uniref:acylphosphatase n=1 Tax=Desulfuromonas sp. TaxID=892 RepID=UPI000CBFB1D1|nr:acylphosphatase [Desulfuromonas sp.]PLX81644.1 MAG: acylphosphatase [Desulfuromonas sp.]
MRPVRATVRIRGLVQGVNFRYFTRRTAIEHDLTGWVRNLPDGDVEAVFEGRETAVRQALDWCRSGPSAARVDELFIDWEDFRGEFESFEVLR